MANCSFLCNVDFESPVVSSGPGHFIPKCQVPCWNTTNTEPNSDPACPIGVIEFWRGAFGPGPHSGNQFVELNAGQQAKLYQDFLAIPGSTVTISFWHAGRAGYANNMQVSIATNIAAVPLVVFGPYVGIVNTWTLHTVTYTFPAVGTNYTIIFETLDPGSGGNFLDDISIVPDTSSVVAASNSPVAVGSPIMLTATTVPGAISYSWVGPNGFASLQQNPTIAVSTPPMGGLYTVTVTDQYGCEIQASTTVVILQGPCFLVTDCAGIQPPFVTSTNLSAYVGQTVQTCINTTPPRIGQGPTVSAANCYILTDCCDPTNTLIIEKPPSEFAFPNWGGLVITFPVLYPGICWSIMPYTCTNGQGLILPWVTIVANNEYQLNDTCASCAIFTGVDCNIPYNHYTFTNCCDPQVVLYVGVTNNAPFPYEGLVVQIPSVPELGNDCWFVEKGLNVLNPVVVNPLVNTITSYADCDSAPCTCAQNWPDGCYCATITLATDCIGNAPWPGVIYETFPDCAACNRTCYILTDCAGILDPILVSNDFSAFVDQIIQLENCGPTCWTVTEALPVITGCCWTIPNLQGVLNRIIVINGVIYTIPLGNLTVLLTYLNGLGFGTWTGTAVQGQLLLCVDGSEDFGDIVITQDPTVTVISPVCESIEYDCDEAVCVPPVSAAFVDCETCLPPPVEPEPLVLHPRRIKPGYYTPGCNPEYTEKVSCNFGENVYNQMLSVRFGINVCCDDDTQKWDIKKQLLDLRAIYDPDACKSAYANCCPPCNVEATLYVFTPMACPAPSNAVPSINYGPCTIWDVTAPVGNGSNVSYKDCNNNTVNFTLPSGQTTSVCALFVSDVPKGIVTDTGVPCP